MIIKIEKLHEAGYTPSLQGLALNKKQPVEKMIDVAKKLCDKDGGHNKFLEHIDTWWMIRAPLYWWKQMDTYRLTTKQSESTMHTLVSEMKDIEDIIQWKIENFSEYTSTATVIDFVKYFENNDYNVQIIQANLPMGFLQTRECKFSYKNLRNMIQQRKNHKLQEWKIFCNEVLEQVSHSELLKI